ncbi:MAG: hypothetical protein ACJ790_02655 [Myxococcaceae bacterium]
MQRLLFAGFLVVLAAACGPNPQAPVQVMALVNKTAKGYEPTQVELKTLHDVVAMKGDVATFIGGAHITLADDDPAIAVPLGDDQFAAAIVKNKGGDVHASFIEKDHILWPADFHTWNMVTLYFNIEKTTEYFQANGATATELGAIPIYYFPEYRVGSVISNPTKDNAFYLAPLHGMLILPFDKFQDTPLAMAQTVISHEYSHSVFNKRVFQDQGQINAYGVWAAGGVPGATNAMKSLDEGLADFHAYGASCRSSAGCNPNLYSKVLPDSLASARELAHADRCLSTVDRQSKLETMDSQTFIQNGYLYQVGTVIASSLYQAAEKTGQRDELEKNILAAYTDTTAATPGFAEIVAQNLNTPAELTLEEIADVMLSHVSDPTLKKQLCNELWGRLKLNIDATHVQHCPIGAAPVTDCGQVP